jgi:large subunit ribosomal protein L10
MALTRAQKEEFVAYLEEAFSTSPIVVFSRYKGLTVVQADELRKKVRAAQGSVKIAKNTLLKIALQKKNLELDQALLDEPLAIVTGRGDQAELAKALKSFSKENEAFEPVSGIMDGVVISTSAINELAALPTQLELKAKLVGTLAAPLTGLVNVIIGPARALVNVLSQYKTQRETAA